jgi:2-(1,2-epoxy-1,2-dihydrophenyl)acetyl-CoA isomerase
MEIIVEHKEGVCFITFNRPEVFNAFNKPMAMAVQNTLDACEKDDTVRAVVLIGTGKAFCAGQDLAEVTDPKGTALKDIVGQHYNPIIKRIRAIEKPIIAAVNGVAAGAGANIALACDIVFAKQSATFIQAFSKIGLIPDSGGTYFLPRIIGVQKALALMMTGDKISAKEAEELNMIYKAVEDATFDSVVHSFVNKIAKMPTRALGLTKKAVNESLSNSLEVQLSLEEKLQNEAGQTKDFNEGVEAFLEKRPAKFIGK